MAVDIISLSEGLQGLPPALLAAGAVVVVALALLVHRLVSNTFPGKAPPVDEGIPFVGGLIKFSKVRWRAHPGPCCTLAGPLHPPAAASVAGAGPAGAAATAFPSVPLCTAWAPQCQRRPSQPSNLDAAAPCRARCRS